MRIGTLCLAASLAVTALAFAEDKKDLPKAPTEQEKAMKATMEKLAAKGEAHQKLATLAGDFKAAATCYMPGSEAKTSEGTNKNELILDGRWLRSDYTGMMNGQPFTGLGLLGYDNSLQKYVGTWIDSMSTQIMQMHGQADTTGNVITLTSEAFCPMANKRVTFRLVYTLAGNDSYKLEMFSPGPDGKEMKGMEITYTRDKPANLTED